MPFRARRPRRACAHAAPHVRQLERRDVLPHGVEAVGQIGTCPVHAADDGRRIGDDAAVGCGGRIDGDVVHAGLRRRVVEATGAPRHALRLRPGK